MKSRQMLITSRLPAAFTALSVSLSVSACVMNDEPPQGACPGLRQVLDFMASAAESKDIWETALKARSQSDKEFDRTQITLFLDGWVRGEELTLTDAECLNIENGRRLVHVTSRSNTIGDIGISFVVADEDVNVVSLLVYSAMVVEP